MSRMPLPDTRAVPRYHITVGEGVPLAEQLSSSLLPAVVYTGEGRGAKVGGVPVTGCEDILLTDKYTARHAPDSIKTKKG